MAELREKCIVIDDDPDMLDLVGQMAKSIDLEIEGYTRPLDFLRNFKCRGPGVIVSDLIMPEMTGVELLNSMRIQRIPLPFIVVTGFADLDASISAFRAGAFDFIQKPFGKSSFLATLVRAVTHSRLAFTEHNRQREIESMVSRLTDREARVLRDMVDGATNKETARKLGISHRTVEHHRQHGLKKFGVRSVMEIGTAEWRDALNNATSVGFNLPKPESATAGSGAARAFRLAPGERRTVNRREPADFDLSLA